ncbi:hypothetical protein GQ55_6G177800 [Panicum hallii var. hallii]|uniref:F-box domain-containing protein n=1 Tax=Panicum hallii var. hallii TaxID=1504633 RepID=A0A2T7D6Z7_9POAL|nr:hypothetical protein GQ55_6G177800 [Panicum hallii var. hallii]
MAPDDAWTTSIHDVPEDLLEVILLRVSSPVCLALAGAACKLWRRVIAGARFAGLYRSLHAPAAAGYYFNSCRSFWTMMAKPWASIGPSFDTLPSAAATGRGGLLLIEFNGLHYIPRTFPDVLVVCEPLTRRYEKIPPPLDFDRRSCTYWRSYLVDGEGEEAAVGGRTIRMSNFRVLCEMYRGGVARAAVFTAGSGGAGSSWSERAIGHVVPKLDPTRRILGHAGGSWYYFYIKGMTMWIKYNLYVTEGRDGDHRIFSLLDGTVKVFARLGGAGGGWALERSVSLRYNDKWHMYLWATGPGFIIVALEYTRARQFLSVDLETMEVKAAAEEKWDTLYPCTLPCPPALRACLDIDR